MNLEHLGSARKVVITILLLAIITLLDFISGNEISFSIFYLIPISFAAWYINRNTGIIFSLISAILWFINDSLNSPVYSNNLIPYWNALVRLGYFLLNTILLSGIKNNIEREKEILQFIVHDLRSPLSSILTSFKLLSEDENEPPTSNQKELIDLSFGSGNRMMIFINSLLDLARLEKKKMPVEIKNNDLNLLLKSAVESVEVLALEKNIKINISSKVDYINVDYNLFIRVIVNLLSNAIKVSDRNAIIEISSEKTDNKFIIAIIDQGPGIPKEMEGRIFGKFTQMPGAASGSGIGLAFCKLAVELHNGKISVKNSLNKGATITIELPV